MKSKFKLIGIIALTAIVGFGILSCDIGDEKVSYTVGYNANGGSGTVPATQTANAGTSITVAGQGSLTYSGRIFSGWNTRANGSGTSYAAGSSMTVRADLTLYAQWIVNSGITYTVTYDANGGSGTAPAAQTVNAGVSITIADQGGLTYSGRSFSGWNTQANGSGTSYADGSSMTVNEDVILYAQWTGSGNGNGGGSNYAWRWSEQTTYSVSGGEVDSVSDQTVYNWISYINETNHEYEYSTISQINRVNTFGSYTDTQTLSSVTTGKATRNGQTYVYTSRSVSDHTHTLVHHDVSLQHLDTTTCTVVESESISTHVYHSLSDLISKSTLVMFSTTNGTPTIGYPINSETVYTIELLSDTDGARTYRRSLANGGAYTEHIIQNGVTLETRYYTAAGILSSIGTNTFPDNAVIRAKLPTFTLSSLSNINYQTVEVLSDSATELVIRVKTFNTNNVLGRQIDMCYERISLN